MLKVLTEGCEPKRATKYSAAVDLFAAVDIVIGAGETCRVPLGVCIDEGFIRTNIEELQEEKYNNIEVYADGDWIDFFKMSHYLQVSPRSSLGLKGLIIPNGIGIIDLDYKGEICLILHNPIMAKKTDFHTGNYIISKGEKIAQIMLCEHKSYLLGYDSEDVRSGGFGSSGN